MLKFIRASIIVLSLLLTAGLITFWSTGTRKGVCIYWARDPGMNPVEGRYWQIDSINGRIQLLALERYPEHVPMKFTRSDRGSMSRTDGPLVGAVIMARFGKDPIRLPGLMIDTGRATAFPVVMTGNLSMVSLTTPTTMASPTYLLSAQPGTTLNVNVAPSPTVTTTPGSGIVSIAGSGVVGASSSTGQTLTYSGVAQVQSSNVAISSSSVSGTAGTIRVTGGTLTFASTGGNKPYVFITAHPALLGSVLLLPVLIEIALLVRRRQIRAVRLRTNHCIECNYDLSGAPHERCPECGRVIAIP